MITEANILYHEMIGLSTTVVTSSNSNIVGACGKIVDETRSMFIINTKKGFKMFPKNHSCWKFHLVDSDITLSGSLLEKRSFERQEFKI